MFPVYYSAAPPLTAARGCPRATYFNFKNRQQGQLVLLFTMKIQYHPSNSRHIQAATICCTRHLGAFYQGVLSVWCVYGHCNLTSHFTGLNLSDNQTCSSFLTTHSLPANVFADPEKGSYWTLEAECQMNSGICGNLFQPAKRLNKQLRPGLEGPRKHNPYYNQIIK